MTTRAHTHGMAGKVERPTYNLEFWLSDAPKRFEDDGEYLYMSKRHMNGEIGERSIGLPIADLAEVVAILNKILKGNAK